MTLSVCIRRTTATIGRNLRTSVWSFYMCNHEPGFRAGVQDSRSISQGFRKLQTTSLLPCRLDKLVTEGYVHIENTLRDVELKEKKWPGQVNIEMVDFQT